MNALQRIAGAATAVASGALAYAESTRLGGLRDASGAVRPVNIGVTVANPSLTTTLSRPNVSVAISPWLVGAGVLAVGLVIVYLRRR